MVLLCFATVVTISRDGETQAFFVKGQQSPRPSIPCRLHEASRLMRFAPARASCIRRFQPRMLPNAFESILFHLVSSAPSKNAACEAYK